ncbi:MAG: hypothetical protein K6F33_05435 [Bacteroidales bacterium]|nr:hypothetical protein [Bacteroidales bacterium]
MKKYFTLLIILLFSLCTAADAQVYKLKKLQLGFQNSAAGLFKCEDLTPHFTHIVIREESNRDLYLYLYNANTGARPFYYKMKKPDTKTQNTVCYTLKRKSPTGPNWSDAVLTFSGKKMIMKLENASDQWNGRIYYIYTAKATGDESVLKALY